MKIDEVTDHSSLDAWLNALPEDRRRETGGRIAARAAIRVAPLAFGAFSDPNQPINHVSKGPLTALPVFGAMTISGARMLYTAPLIAVAAAADAAAAAADAATAFAATATAFAADAAAFAATATADFVDLWPMIRADLRWCADRPDTPAPPLWHGEPEPAEIRAAWETTKQNLIHKEDDDWSFWIAVFERLRDGRDIHADALAPILNPLRADDWDKGPAHINPMFDDVLDAYRAEDLERTIAATPMGEDVVYDPPADNFVLRPKDRISEDYLDDVREQILAAVRIFQGDGDHNLAGALRRELRILEDTVARNQKRPVLILRDIDRVLGRLDHKQKSEGVPTAEADADIFDFTDSLKHVQIDLIAFSTEVRMYHEARKPTARNEDLAQIAEAAGIAKEAGDAELAASLEDAVAIIADPEAVDLERRISFYSVVSRLTRMYSVSRKILKESVDLGKDIVVTGAAAQWLVAQPKVQQAIEIIVKFFTQGPQ